MPPVCQMMVAMGAVVVNGQKSFYFDNRDKGLQSAYVAADVGAFTGAASGADIRARASASYAIDEQTGLNATASYEGEKFAAGAERPNFGGVFDQRVGARTNLSVGANWRADQPWGAFKSCVIRVAGLCAPPGRRRSGDGYKFQCRCEHPDRRNRP